MRRKQETAQDNEKLGQWLAYWTEVSMLERPLQDIEELDNWLLAENRPVLTNGLQLWKLNKSMDSVAAIKKQQQELGLDEYPRAAKPEVPAGWLPTQQLQVPHEPIQVPAQARAMPASPPAAEVQHAMPGVQIVVAAPEPVLDVVDPEQVVPDHVTFEDLGLFDDG